MSESQNPLWSQLWNVFNVKSKVILRFLIHIFWWRFSELRVIWSSNKQCINVLFSNSIPLMWFEIEADWIAVCSRCCARSTLNLISVISRHLAQSQSSASGNFTPSLSDIPLTLWLSYWYFFHCSLKLFIILETKNQSHLWVLSKLLNFHVTH